MKILIAGLVKNYQVKRFQEEARKFGHIVEGCYASDLVLYAENGKFEVSLKSGKDITSYDLIYMITGSRKWEWYTAALYLNKRYRTIIVNHKAIDPAYNFYLTPAIDYLKQVEVGLPLPKSAVCFSEKSVDAILNKFTFPLIVKPANGRKGKGVSKVSNRNELIKAAKELLEDKKDAFVVREFIPNDGDVRVFTVGYKAIGAMKRIPKEGEFRANISQGGHGEVFDLEKYPEVRELAEKMSKTMKTEIAGVDVITDKGTGKHYILEINPAPQFEGMEKYTKVNVAATILQYFQSLRK